MSLLEGVDHRQHGGGLGLVALERLHHQRKPRRVGEQTDGDLPVQATFLLEPGLAEPVGGIGLEIRRAHVVEHQRRRAQPGMLSARRRQCLAHRAFGEHRQATRYGAVGDRLDAGLTRNESALLVGSMTLANTRFRNTSSPPAAWSNPSAS